MLELRPLTAVQEINYGVPNKFEACEVEIMQCDSSVKTLTSSLRFSLLKNDLKEFMDILESL